jgi:predicted dithiol-disulfide oxidoreductase (DUF899 family)
MTLPEVVSREQWADARLRLLAEEGEMTHRGRLPVGRIAKEYMFAGPAGPVPLAGLFGDCRQLIVQHIMFGPGWDAACPTCTAFVSALPAGVPARLRSLETAYVLVSRAPLAKISAYQARMGWTLPWYSSYGSDFNYDFQGERSREVPGVSCFRREGGEVFHTYSTGAWAAADHRGYVDAFLDLTGLGRPEDWADPAGRPPGELDG